MSSARVFTTYPVGDASRRLRIDPLINDLQGRNVEVKIHSLLSEKAFELKNGHIFCRIYCGFVLLYNLIIRLILINRKSDLLIVHREVFPFFTPAIERIAIRNALISVLDVDDAIYERPTHSKDWRRHLRNPSRAGEFALYFDLILCGNRHLMEHFSGKHAKTLLVPTCPPLEIHRRSDVWKEEMVIAWIGSQSTLGSLKRVLPAVLSACNFHDARLVVLGGANVESLPPHPCLTVERWSQEREYSLLAMASIGLMPLPDTEWERGKSGYKAILYLVAGLHAVIAPIGVNLELIETYPAAVSCEDDDWMNTLSNVIVAVRDGGLDVHSRDMARRFYDPERNSSSAVESMLGRNFTT